MVAKNPQTPPWRMPTHRKSDTEVTPAEKNLEEQMVSSNKNKEIAILYIPREKGSNTACQ